LGNNNSSLKSKSVPWKEYVEFTELEITSNVALDVAVQLAALSVFNPHSRMSLDIIESTADRLTLDSMSFIALKLCLLTPI
jgi:hypothetical protein